MGRCLVDTYRKTFRQSLLRIIVVNCPPPLNLSGLFIQAGEAVVPIFSKRWMGIQDVAAIFISPWTSGQRIRRSRKELFEQIKFGAIKEGKKQSILPVCDTPGSKLGYGAGLVAEQGFRPSCPIRSYQNVCPTFRFSGEGLQSSARSSRLSPGNYMK